MGFENIDKQEVDILEHKLEPKNENHAQMILAEELYLRNNPKADIKDHNVRNAIMIRWSDQSAGDSYSHAFRKVMESKNGDFKSITLAEIEKWLGENSPK